MDDDHALRQVLERREALLLGERGILECVATGAPLAEILAAIARLVEAHGEGLIATVLLLDDFGRLHVGAAPSLPAWFNDYIDGQEVGPTAGSCGTAVFHRHPVCTPDIAHDPLWERYREFALRAGLAACWSVPLLDRDGRVLGTLAHYYRTPQDPTPRDLWLGDIARRLAEIAIQHERSAAALRRANAELEQRVADRSRDLLSSERLLGESQGLAHLGSWGWDIATNVVRWSDELYRIYGMAPQSFGATFEDFLAQIHVEDRERIRTMVEEALRTCRPFASEERIVRPDGEERVLASRGRVEVDAAGRATHLWGICLDITERKRAEAERAASELREREALVQAESAREVTRLKSAFINSVSHDLRTPLTAILGFLEFIEDGVGGPVTPAQQELIRGVFTNTRRLQRLVDDLLDSARLGAGTFALRRQPTDLVAVVDDVVESLVPQAEAARVSVTFLPVDGPALAELDPQRIEQVVANLLTNALKFTPAGGTVTLAVAQTPERVRFTVTDPGPGFAPEDKPRLFLPFGQLAAGASMGGTGLGLAISKELVVAHGGQIGADSRLGHGSTFWFELPKGELQGS
ncbi:MAG: multi-sensor hybrid histidine kinase [Cyanobacteria bacterium RYN_339]|nr:multi-sensor hybrid histidine kinase [Cyanobacteria bacterium RYN_339]